MFIHFVVTYRPNHPIWKITSYELHTSQIQHRANFTPVTIDWAIRLEHLSSCEKNYKNRNHITAKAEAVAKIAASERKMESLGKYDSDEEEIKPTKKSESRVNTKIFSISSKHFCFHYNLERKLFSQLRLAVKFVHAISYLTIDTK